MAHYIAPLVKGFNKIKLDNNSYYTSVTSNSILEFNEILLRKTLDGKIEIGKPFVKGVMKASIVKQMKEPKVISFMFKRRKKVRVKKGHRQPKTIVRIESI